MGKINTILSLVVDITLPQRDSSMDVIRVSNTIIVRKRMVEEVERRLQVAYATVVAGPAVAIPVPG